MQNQILTMSTEFFKKSAINFYTNNIIQEKERKEQIQWKNKLLTEQFEENTPAWFNELKKSKEVDHNIWEKVISSKEEDYTILKKETMIKEKSYKNQEETSKAELDFPLLLNIQMHQWTQQLRGKLL